MGILIAHVAWAVFFTVGSVVRAAFSQTGLEPRRLSHAAALLEIVLSSATGIACVGLVSFFIGLFPAIYPVTILLFLSALGAVAFARNDSPLKPRFWLTRLRVWKSALSPEAGLLYVLGLVIAISAVIPDTGSDATSYHMVYAYDWATSHHIYVDQWLRMPYYANNWLLIQMWMIELGALPFVTFITWLTGLLTLLGVMGAILEFAPQGPDNAAGDPGVGTRVVAVLAPLTLVLSATFLLNMTSEMVDVPIGFFFLASCLSVMLALRGSKRYLVDAVVCAAFFVGMKISLIAFFPAFAIAIYMLLGQRPPKRTLVVLAAFALLALPWYGKNFIQAGDPISPTLNILFRGADPKMSVADFHNVVGNLGRDTRPESMLSVPLRIFSDPTAQQFREPGETAILLLLMLPGALLAYYALFRKDLAPATSVLFLYAITFYAIAYWTNTSYLARYALLFYPTLAITIPVFALYVTRPIKYAVWAVAMVVILCAVPTPAAAGFLSDTIWHNRITQIWSLYHGREDWINTHNPFNEEVQYTASALIRSNQTKRHVYAFQLEITSLFFRERGITSIGDWFGPGRYHDFSTAIRENDLAGFIREFNIAAFIVPVGDYFSDSAYGPSRADMTQFDVEAAQLGYTRTLLPGWHYAVYLAPGIN